LANFQLPFLAEEIVAGIQGGLDASKITFSFTPPEFPEELDVWVENTSNIPYLFHDDTWKPILSGIPSGQFTPRITYSVISPLDPNSGDFWIKATTMKLYSFIPPYWVQV
jgi:hypothetical protein